MFVAADFLIPLAHLSLDQGRMRFVDGVDSDRQISTFVRMTCGSSCHSNF
jgi:hypothetical protein